MGLGAPYESLAACKHRFKRESKSVPELNLTNLRTQLRYSEIAAGYLTSVSRIRQRLYVEVWLLTAPAPPVLPLPSIKLLLQCPFKFPLATKPLPDPLRESRRWSQQSHAPNFHPQITSVNRNPRMDKLPMILVCEDRDVQVARFQSSVRAHRKRQGEDLYSTAQREPMGNTQSQSLGSSTVTSVRDLLQVQAQVQVSQLMRRERVPQANEYHPTHTLSKSDSNSFSGARRSRQ
ncbi:unnamed protein product [Diplocarpon coronariae]